MLRHSLENADASPISTQSFFFTQLPRFSLFFLVYRCVLGFAAAWQNDGDRIFNAEECLFGEGLRHLQTPC